MTVQAALAGLQAQVPVSVQQIQIQIRDQRDRQKQDRLQARRNSALKLRRDLASL